MPAKIDWYYHRNNCATCQKSQTAITKAKAAVTEQVDARKERLGPDAALTLARSAGVWWAARGAKVVHLDISKDQPTDPELLKLLIGPSGFLRAPTVRR